MIYTYLKRLKKASGRDVVEQWNLSFSAGQNAKGVLATLERQFLTKLNMPLPHDPAILLLGISLSKRKTYACINIVMNIYSAFCKCQKIGNLNVSGTSIQSATQQ